MNDDTTSQDQARRTAEATAAALKRCPLEPGTARLAEAICSAPVRVPTKALPNKSQPVLVWVTLWWSPTRGCWMTEMHRTEAEAAASANNVPSIPTYIVYVVIPSPTGGEG